MHRQHIYKEGLLLTLLNPVYCINARISMVDSATQSAKYEGLTIRSGFGVGFTRVDAETIRPSYARRVNPKLEGLGLKVLCSY